MSYGGPTWATAGALDQGDDNTFDADDVTEGGTERPYNHGWWTYTPAADQVVRIDTAGTTSGGFFNPDTMIVVYAGGTGPDDATVVVENDDDDIHGDILAAVSFAVTAGTTYHLLVGTFNDGSFRFGTYHVSLEILGAAVPRATAWLSTLRDRDDNQIVVGGDASPLIDENPWPAWQTPQSWYDNLVKGPSGERPLGREAHYRIQSVASGTSLLDGADECAWAHAVNGDQSAAVTLWNTDTVSAGDHGPPTCRPLGEGAIVEAAVGAMRYKLDYNPPGPLTAGGMTAEVDLSAWAPAFRYARDNLTERGALPLSLADPVADGVPDEYAADATLEWEGDLELVSIEITGDAFGGDVPSTEAVTFFVNESTVGPLPAGGGTFTTWQHGLLGGSSDLSFNYEDGVDWHTLAAFTDFADVADSGPDVVVTGAMEVTLVDTVPAAWLDPAAGPRDFVERFNGSQVGFRLTFRSPRYRWHWIEISTPVVRQWPRDDARGVSSAPRLWPPSKSRRLAGGYPGGSNA